MQIEVTLNDMKTGFWGFEDEKHKIYLTFVDPGPVQLDLGSMTEQNQEYIIANIDQGFLKCDITTGEILSLLGSKQAPATIPKEENGYQDQIDAAVEKAKKKQQKMEEKAEWILTKNIRAVKKEVSNSENLTFLNLLVKLEKEGKNRSTVLDAIKYRKRILIEGKLKPGVKPQPTGEVLDDKFIVEDYSELEIIIQD